MQNSCASSRLPLDCFYFNLSLHFQWPIELGTRSIRCTVLHAPCKLYLITKLVQSALELVDCICRYICCAEFSSNETAYCIANEHIGAYHLNGAPNVFGQVLFSWKHDTCICHARRLSFFYYSFNRYFCWLTARIMDYICEHWPPAPNCTLSKDTSRR